MRIAIIGGGWAGLAAAVRAVTMGHQVTLLEMSSSLGGRARAVDHQGQRFDNGQHILIGAYCETLALMRLLGVDIDQALQRLPLTLLKPDGLGLALTTTSSPATFCAAVLRPQTWSWVSRVSLLLTSTRWALQGFRCAPASH